MSPDIEAAFQRELALLEAESMGWTHLEPGVYLHASDANATRVLVVGVPEAGAAVLLVGSGGNDSSYWSFKRNRMKVTGGVPNQIWPSPGWVGSALGRI